MAFEQCCSNSKMIAAIDTSTQIIIFIKRIHHIQIFGHENTIIIRGTDEYHQDPRNSEVYRGGVLACTAGAGLLLLYLSAHSRRNYQRQSKTRIISCCRVIGDVPFLLILIAMVAQLCPLQFSSVPPLSLEEFVLRWLNLDHETRPS